MLSSKPCSSKKLLKITAMHCSETLYSHLFPMGDRMSSSAPKPSCAGWITTNFTRLHTQFMLPDFFSFHYLPLLCSGVAMFLLPQPWSFALLLCLPRCAPQFNFTSMSSHGSRGSTRKAEQWSSSCFLHCSNFLCVHIWYLWVHFCFLSLT